MPVLPVVSILASIYLMLNLPAATWIRFIIWMAIGFGVYFLYSQRNSRLRLAQDAGDGGYASGEQGSTARAGETEAR